jgi:pSer/pThr/pTyr-binding forkhead associated (FHA) protein
MPLTLIVRAETGDNRELSFDGDRVVIGRKSGSELWLPDPSVSLRHASVRAQGSDYAVFDEGSVNGTFVGGVRLERGASRQLRSGDMMRVGRVWVEVRLGGACAVALNAAGATRDLALALVEGAMRAAGDDIAPRVSVVEGYDVGEEAFLREDAIPVVIGRGEGCNVALSDVDVSREHVCVVRRGSSIHVMDLGSKNGSFLGERRLPPHQEVHWKGQVALKLGRTVIALLEPVALALLQLEDAPDEPVREDDVRDEPQASAASDRMKTARSEKPEAEPSERSASQFDVASGGITGRVPAAAVPSGSASPAPTVAVAKKNWNSTDLTLVFVALGILAASLVGLAWVLRG